VEQEEQSPRKPGWPAMGVTQQLPERDRYIYPREYMLDRLAVMMGGRAAEELVLGTMTSGAENDLKHATQLARKMVLDWGMSEKLGHMALGGRRQQVFLGEEIAHRREYSEATAREVDEEIKLIVDEAYQRARETLQTHRHKLDAVADALLEREEIPGDEVLRLVGVERETGTYLYGNLRPGVASLSEVGEDEMLAAGDAEIAAPDMSQVVSLFQELCALVEGYQGISPVIKRSIRAELERVAKDVTGGKEQDEEPIADHLCAIERLSPQIYQLVIEKLAGPEADSAPVVQRVARRMVDTD